MFINNLEVKSKLILMLLFPLLGLIVFAFLQSSDYFKKYNSMEKLKEVTIFSTKISALVHEMQKERGLTAGYINSNGKKLKEKLLTQRESTNQKIQEYKTSLNNLDMSRYSESLNVIINNSSNKLNQIQNKRDEILSLNSKLNEALTFYTSTNNSFLNVILNISDYSDNASFSKQINSYSSFLYAKDKTGIERAVGATTFANDKFLPGMRTQMSSLIAQQNAYLDMFINYSDEKVKKFYYKTVAGQTINEVNKMREIALNANDIGGFGVDSTFWFNKITSKINKLKEVEDFISSNIIIKNVYLRNVVVLAQSLSDMLHETQKERGATAGYLGSKGTKFKNELPSQRENTNNKLLALKSTLNKLKIDAYSRDIQNNIKKSMLNIEQTLALRSKVDSLSIPTKDAIKAYTNMNAQFLNTIAAIAKLPKDSKVSATLITFYNFLMSKERAGIERAIMSNVFASNKFTGDSKNKFATLVTEQNTFNKSFLATANKEISEFYKKTLTGSDIIEVNKMREIAFKADTIGGFGVDSTYWFNAISEKINRLKKVDDFQANLLIKDATRIANESYQSFLTVIIAAIVLIICGLLLGITIANKMVISLENFQKGLKEFFSFLNYESKDVSLLTNESKDEFGQMTNSINDNITKTKENILQDRKLIDETIQISNRISKGHLDGKISENSANPALNELKDILNGTIEGLNGNLKEIESVLISYSNLDYLPTIKNDEMEGVIAKLIEDINKLGETVTKTLIINKRNGMILETDADVLLQNVDNLNTTSNEAASSLEETAAALEEITSTIVSNNSNLSTMTTYADKVTSSAKSGEELANNTMRAMDEINDEVGSITEAIRVIDQIAFQTNILSLNAAVEAAKAGDAGKGFAVVAQEVRNLASRSSESAKQIKDIVESATARANVGKEIANNMLEGYVEFNTDIEKTISLMYDVNSSSKEQQAGIVQINQAVAQIDQQTQFNAASAAKTYEIAIATKKLSESIVTEANKKEFRGKDTVRDKRSTYIDKSYSGNEKRRTETHIKEHPIKSGRRSAINIEDFYANKKKSS